MNPEFVPITDEKPGIIAAMLRAGYADLLRSDSRWASEQVNWDVYDRQVFARRDTVGACLFLTRADGDIAGFASWDPRQKPRYGIIGHNCILPQFRGAGFGGRQIQEILRRFQMLGIRTALATTCDHSFFIPAQRMYLACGFREARRTAWDRDRSIMTIEYAREICCDPTDSVEGNSMRGTDGRQRAQPGP
jgi:GNAT superfamily N-acetyltransferase